MHSMQYTFHAGYSAGCSQHSDDLLSIIAACLSSEPAISRSAEQIKQCVSKLLIYKLVQTV